MLLLVLLFTINAALILKNLTKEKTGVHPRIDKIKVIIFKYSTLDLDSGTLVSA